MASVTAVILAAGLSRRMGARNKLLLPVGDVPMIRHVVNAYRAAKIENIIVVTGHQAESVKGALEGSGVKICFNPDFAKGQHTSVDCGLHAAKGSGEILIGLGDQPLLTADDIRKLIATHTTGDVSRISIPALGQVRGNPILVPASLHARLLSDPRSPGCQKFTRNHPENVQFHALTSPGFYTDVDTPDSYTALKAGKREEIS